MAITGRCAIGSLLAALLTSVSIAQVSAVESESQVIVGDDEEISGRVSVDGFSPNIKPTLRISATDSAIQIDGDLTDFAWGAAARATNFSETFPDEGAKPPIDVEVLATYDSEFLYIAFVVPDEPSSIRANLSDRDRIWSDDFVAVALDTEGEGQSVYYIAANPFGVQGDARMGLWWDDSYNLVFESAGKITESGYQVELAIPFRSLRFPSDEKQHWRATFDVSHPRDSGNEYSWAFMSRDEQCRPCQFGFIEGIENIRTRRNWEILPTLVGSQTGGLVNASDASDGFDNARMTVDPSIGFKLGITSDLSAEGTINPDFSQIESDAARIDVNTMFALWYPENRPFFQEGGNLFQTFFETVYTRSINDPVVAGKMIGKVKGADVAFLSARDLNTPLLLPFEEKSILVEAGHSTSNIARVKYAFPDNSFLGVLITDRRIDGGGSGTALSVDGSANLGDKYALAGQLVSTRTTELDDPDLSLDFASETFDRGAHTAALDGERFRGHALVLIFSRNARHWLFNTRYAHHSPTFRVDNGFENQNDGRVVSGFTGVNIYPKDIGLIDRIFPSIFGRVLWNYDGLRKQARVTPRIAFNLKGQTFVGSYYSVRMERFAGVEFSGLGSLGVWANSSFSKRISFNFYMEAGRDLYLDFSAPEIGRSRFYQGGIRVRPTGRLSIQPQISYSALYDRETGDAFFNGYILRTRMEYQALRKLALRTVIQYNDFSERLQVDPLITYRVNPFTVFYMGSTHDLRSVETSQPGVETQFLQTRRQVFFKLQYLVRA